MKSLPIILSILFASLLFVETEVRAEDIDLEDSDDDGIPDDEVGAHGRYGIFSPHQQSVYLLKRALT